MEITLFKDKQDDTVFKMINPNNDDCLSMMSEKELKEFIELLDNYKIAWHENLNIDKNTTFGTEIEFVNADTEKIEKGFLASKKCKNWENSEDTSLSEPIEIITREGDKKILKSRE